MRGAPEKKCICLILYFLASIYFRLCRNLLIISVDVSYSKNALFFYRGPRNPSRGHKLLCSHHHVLLLPSGSPWTGSTETPLVEEVFNISADSKCPPSIKRILTPLTDTLKFLPYTAGNSKTILYSVPRTLSSRIAL